MLTSVTGKLEPQEKLVVGSSPMQAEMVKPKSFGDSGHFDLSVGVS